jgi:hypothetical protein
MTEPAADAVTTRTSVRRTLVLLLGWLVAAVLAGVPAGEAGTANADPSARKVPVVVNTGPECFAGHAPPAAPGKGRD